MKLLKKIARGLRRLTGGLTGETNLDSSATENEVAAVAAGPNYVFRAPRISITPLHRLEFRPKGSASKQPYRLSNISTSGLGLIASERADFPRSGTTLEGDLVFDENGKDEVFPLRLKIVHVTGGVLGVAFDFDDDGTLLRQAIRRYFELEILALGMMRVNPQYHRREPDGESHWIHGDYCDLYFVEAENRVLRFRLTFLGNRFSGGSGGETPGEQLHDTDPGIAPTPAGPELIDTALKFLRNVPDIEESHRAAIAEMLQART